MSKKRTDKLPLDKQLLKITVIAVGLGELFRNYYAASKLEWFTNIENYYGVMIKKADEANQPKLVKYLKGERKRKLNQLYKSTKQQEDTLNKMIDTFKGFTTGMDAMIESFVDSLEQEVYKLVEVDDENVTIRNLKDVIKEEETV